MCLAIHKENLSWIIVGGIFILAATLDGMRILKPVAEDKEVVQIPVYLSLLFSSGSLSSIVFSYRSPPLIQTNLSNINFKLLDGAYQLIESIIPPGICHIQPCIHFHFPLQVFSSSFPSYNSYRAIHKAPSR